MEASSVGRSPKLPSNLRKCEKRFDTIERMEQKHSRQNNKVIRTNGKTEKVEVKFLPEKSLF